MNRFASILLLCLLLPLFVRTQTPVRDTAVLRIETPAGPTPWTSLDFNNDARNFQFAIVTDRTCCHREGVFLDGVRKLNLLQPEFVLSVGDLIEGYTTDTVELIRQWEEFDGFIDELEMPFFYVPGNHDITNDVMEELWKERLGPTYYSFVYHDVLFLCLNSEDQYRGAGRGSISDEQYEWIRQVLAEHPDARWTLLFMHQPLWLQETDPVRWAEVEGLLRDRRHTVFVGHRHHYVKYERNNGKYFMLGTTGGGSPLRGPELGEFDHVVWVTMTDEGPVIANLALNGIWDENVVDEATQDFISEVSEKPFLRIEPLYVPDDTFSEGQVRLRLTNDEDVPMVVRLHTGFSWDYTTGLEADSILVNPNSVAFTEVTLRPRGQKPLTATDPVALKASVEFPADDRPDIAIPFDYQLRPEPYRTLLRAERPVTVDADLAEWPDLPYTISGPDTNDVQGRFQLMYDENFLYVAGAVTDDQINADTSEATWRQDYAGFRLSAAPLAESAMLTGADWTGNSLYLITVPETENAPRQTYDYRELPEGLTYRCRAEGNIYRFEAAVPLSYVTEQQGKHWRSIRVNFTLQDWDRDETGRPRYHWQPDWDGDDNRVGSGMFFREAAPGKGSEPGRG